MESKGTYGSPRIHQELKKCNLSCSVNTVAKAMCQLGIKVGHKKKYRPQTTNSNHAFPVADRIFKTEEELPQLPNQVWASDITYLKISNGEWRYLSVVMDLFNREVIGWSIDPTLQTMGVATALQSAIINRGTDTKTIFHSDRGVQYASEAFRSLLSGNKFIPSMSRKGNCYDNCYVESFFKTLKSDLENMNIVLTRENIQSKIFKYIETWYNRKRLHSSLSYMSPYDYASQNALPTQIS